MSSFEASFWSDLEKYHELAQEFEQNISITNPNELTGRSGYYSCGCFWCASEVTYYEYTGESI